MVMRTGWTNAWSTGSIRNAVPATTPAGSVPSYGMAARLISLLTDQAGTSTVTSSFGPPMKVPPSGPTGQSEQVWPNGRDVHAARNRIP